MERQRTCETLAPMEAPGVFLRRKNATTADCEIDFLSREHRSSSTRSAARHASLIRSWHNDCASRVAGPRVLVCFATCNHPHSSASSGTFYKVSCHVRIVRRISQIANETRTRYLRCVRVRFRDTDCPGRLSFLPHLRKFRLMKNFFLENWLRML